MEVYLSSKYRKSHKRIIKKNPRLQPKIKKQLKILLDNPRHPSLNLHKLEGRLHTNWSIRIQKDIRLTFTYVKEGILLLNIGSHDQVY